ncbi:PASTA domain-containing protein [Polluticaenibacter yanchengensis]|uniref:PASTA domain-containing protein n=1 Tax=Polluticaenibacter yanchengensis TaxID=3014562 RepID=A0ABT4UHH5_9BACT|nr:PASTA domain-containing protein [Chitinophagaceae bacterium LY-5]
MFKFLTRRHFLVNLLVAGLLAVGILFSVLWGLGFMTQHGKIRTVPTVIGKSFTEATQILEKDGFRVVVSDSVWEDNKAPLSVIKQSPDADNIVKANRTIYLTINKSAAPLIEVPNMVGLSFRNAEILIKQLGFKLGDTTRRTYFAKNSILEQTYRGGVLAVGTKLPLGSAIGLVLGSGVGNEEFDVPTLTGLSYSDAKSLIESLGLMLTHPIVDSDVRDTSSAFVYRQKPEKYTKFPDGSKTVNKIRSGQNVDIWLSREMKIIADSTGTEDSGTKTNDYE